MALIPTKAPPLTRARSAIAAIAAAGLILAVVGAAAAAADETAARVDKLFAAWDRPDSPGAALAIIRDGEIVYERSYGLARIEDGLANTPDKIFDVGSVSKQFTAACVAFLVREGKIGLDDDIRKYLPEMPDYGTPVTVRHLLHHTSGLRDYNALLSLAGFRPESDCPTVEEALEIVARQKKLNYAPGEEYSYTNTGFFLLSQIVERVSGTSLNAFAQERIFKPLGMTKTLFQDDHTQVIKDRATGYAKGGKNWAVSMSNWDETGDGNVYTTVRDMAKWDQAFYSGALGPGLTEMMQETGRLNSGKAINYAWGLVVREYKGLKVVEHGGAWVGFRAAIVRFPEQRFSVVILANLDAIDPSGIAFRVADIYLADLIKAPAKGEAKKTPAINAPKAEPVKALSVEELKGYAGTYVSEELLDVRYKLTVEEDRLRIEMRTLEPAPLKAVAPDKFTLPSYGMTVEFARGDGGKVMGFTVSVGRAAGIAFVKK